MRSSEGPSSIRSSGAAPVRQINMISGNVLRIEKSSIHDGEGLRTVVFLNGCPLSCKWCSTPESQCVHMEAGQKAGYGRIMTAEEVVRDVAKDSIFFHHSGGGVTLSGGEMLYQPDFAEAILRGCLEEGINTTCETSLYAPYETVKQLAPLLSSIYADFKIWDSGLHRKWVGVPNDLIKENFRRLDESYHGDIHVRIPVIPGINMTEDNMVRTAEFFRGTRCTADIELLAYHRLGTDTYRKLGLEYELADVRTPSPAEMAEMAEIILRTDPGRVVMINGEVYHPEH